ncbi:ABC transporter ATP-binding protein [Hoeflea sp. TYP-13]|uniref:ABC transporter ATP-binding protein n=1 Tax=Hoeflea sp. TYP-13 TaxID=3230023 RepID=UPI0034C6A71D
MKPRLELRNICKRYPGVVANDGISLEVMPGEIHAVLGENGAGKSTLMKIIYGATHADEGEILCDGELIGTHGPSVSRSLGIEMVYQHFALFESVSVAENIALSVNSKYDIATLSNQVSRVSEKYGLPLDPRRLVHHLSVGERQRVEIVRCLMQDPKLLILDEPTSVLTPQAVEKLFVTLRHLASEGCSILYISHKLDEVQALCDMATVLRNGKVTGTAEPKNSTSAELARMMVGADIPETHLDPSTISAEPLLSVSKLSAPALDVFGTDLKEIDLDVHGGEVVGIAGVAGNGQAELVSLLSGERVLPSSHAVKLCGQPSAHLSAADRRRMGLAFVPEERLGRGAVPSHDLGDNAVLTGHRLNMVTRGLLDRRTARGFAGKVIDRFNVKANGPLTVAQSLSGGNLQKYIVGREIELKPQVLLVAQPTWGVDVGAAAFIRQTLIDLSRSGVAVLIISEELDELFEICDRLHVICAGRLSAALKRGEASVEEVGLLMTGLGENNNGSGDHAISN